MDHGHLWNAQLAKLSSFMVDHLTKAISLISENKIQIDQILCEHDAKKMKNSDRMKKCGFLQKRTEPEAPVLAPKNSKNSRSYYHPGDTPRYLPPFPIKIFNQILSIREKIKNVFRFYREGLISRHHLQHFLVLTDRVDDTKDRLVDLRRKMDYHYFNVKNLETERKTSKVFLERRDINPWGKIEKNRDNLTWDFSGFKGRAGRFYQRE